MYNYNFQFRYMPSIIMFEKGPILEQTFVLSNSQMYGLQYSYSWLILHCMQLWQCPSTQLDLPCLVLRGTSCKCVSTSLKTLPVDDSVPSMSYCSSTSLELNLVSEQTVRAFASYNSVAIMYIWSSHASICLNIFNPGVHMFCFSVTVNQWNTCHCTLSFALFTICQGITWSRSLDA